MTTPDALSPSNRRNHMMAVLIHTAAMKLLAGTPLETEVSKAAAVLSARTIARLDPARHEAVFLTKRIIEGLCTKLAACENMEELEETLSYVESLTAGTVTFLPPDAPESELPKNV